MSYIFSFLGKYLIYGFCSLIIYIPIRLIYIKLAKKETYILKEFSLALFFFCFVGMISQTLFPLIRLDLGNMILEAFFNSGNSVVISESGIIYRNENVIVRNLNIIPFKTIFQYIFGNSEIYQGKDWVLNRIVNMLGNLVLFFPIGFLLPLISERFKKIKPALVMGICIILMIEIVQYFIGRSADVDDLILNTVGILCGYAITQIPFIKTNLSKLQKSS